MLQKETKMNNKETLKRLEALKKKLQADIKSKETKKSKQILR